METIYIDLTIVMWSQYNNVQKLYVFVLLIQV